MIKELSNTNHGRFSGDAFYTDKALDITILGIGGIGSNLLYILSAIGNYNYYIYELPNHSIQSINIGTQWYNNSQIGMNKNEAIMANMRLFGSYNKFNYLEEYKKGSGVTPITFVGPDNITTRKEAFEDWVNEHGNNPEAIFIDGRLELFHGFVYVVLGKYAWTQEKYKDTLFEPHEGYVPQCSSKQSKPGSMRIASEMTGVFVNWLYNLHTGEEFRSTPFSIYFDIKSHKYVINNGNN